MNIGFKSPYLSLSLSLYLIFLHFLSLLLSSFILFTLLSLLLPFTPSPSITFTPPTLYHIHSSHPPFSNNNLITELPIYVSQDALQKNPGFAALLQELAANHLTKDGISKDKADRLELV